MYYSYFKRDTLAVIVITRQFFPNNKRLKQNLKNSRNKKNNFFKSTHT